MAYCPQIDGKTPTASSFAYIMGIEPLQLNATIRTSTPPSSVQYRGQSGDGEGLSGNAFTMKVVNWRQANASEYIITAYSEPYFWKLNKISIEMSDPIEGFTREELKNKLEEFLYDGWTIEVQDLEDDEMEELEGLIYTDDYFRERFAFIDFSGSFYQALKMYEEMTGTFGYIDHVNKIIKFDKTVPTMDTFDGAGVVYLYERSEANTINTNKIVLYGNLNHVVEDNELAIAGTGIDAYKGTEIYVDSSAWNVETEIELSSFSDAKVSDTGWQNVTKNNGEIDAEGNPITPHEQVFFEGTNTTAEYVRTETYSRRFEPIITAHTASIIQDEVADRSPREGILNTPDGEEIDTSEGEGYSKQNKTVSTKLEVEFTPPVYDIDKNENVSRISEALKGKKILVAPICDLELAETRSTAASEAIKMDVKGLYTETTTEDTETQSREGDFTLGSNPRNTIYIIPYRDMSGSGSAKASFGLSAYVISSIPVREQKYHNIYKKTIINGQAGDIEPALEEPPTIDTKVSEIAAAFKSILLRFLKFKWSFSSEADRIKFPYAVDSDGKVLEPDEDITDNVDMQTLVVQNNFVSTIRTAKNKAKLLKKVSNLDVEEGYLRLTGNVNFLKCSRYIEVYNTGAYKAIEYIRK